MLSRACAQSQHVFGKGPSIIPACMNIPKVLISFLSWWRFVREFTCWAWRVSWFAPTSIRGQDGCLPVQFGANIPSSVRARTHRVLPHFLKFSAHRLRHRGWLMFSKEKNLWIMDRKIEWYKAWISIDEYQEIFEHKHSSNFQQRLQTCFVERYFENWKWILI